MIKLLTIAIVIAVPVVAVLALLTRGAHADSLKVGDFAPPISTQMVIGDQTVPFDLASYRGKKVILYFYPKDDTPGCTKEACAFRDGYAKYQQAGFFVAGCSVQDEDQHKAFIKKYNLPFPLLLDPDKKIAEEYGAANGIPILGLDRRITYVIDEDGKIEKIYPRVDPAIHANQILAEVKPVPTPTPAMTPAPAATPSANATPEASD